MTTEAQKRQEILFAKRVASLLGEAWEIKEGKNEEEWPDLTVTHQGDTFGVEVLEINIDNSEEGSKLREKENYAKKYLSQLAENYYQKSSIPINVKLSGINRNKENKGKKSKTAQKKNIIDTLVAISKDIEELEQKRVEIHRGCVAYIRRLPARFKNYNQWEYVPDRVGWVHSPSASFFQKELDKKIENLDKYKKHMHDVRVLLVANRAYNSGRIAFSDDIQLNKNGFKNVYILIFPEFVKKF
ncbi:hypothetical protein NH398_05795 [Halomonas sp. CnH100-B]|uniref:hypothetical protein n=1 Tax=Halomonas sp. CnH100-B TaxID=2954490 RepID=UPI0020969597|nr:hypothetical protein [Halomonas sp. CnH100-B]MCO7228744.1 hypothetical protein [Halomonas sp. CnH100-B]